MRPKTDVFDLVFLPFPQMTSGMRQMKRENPEDRRHKNRSTSFYRASSERHKTAKWQAAIFFVNYESIAVFLFEEADDARTISPYKTGGSK